MSTETEEAECYFNVAPQPAHIEKKKEAIEEFVKLHTGSRRIVLVTSGGTTVPLEKSTVRFLDNFSAGTRGAASAEYFLKKGYAVIFMHRQHSLAPFSRKYSHSTNSFLDFLTVRDGEVVASEAVASELAHVLTEYHKVRDAHQLLMVTFVTINDYLWLLRATAQTLAPLGPEAILYLAAAVSDFFIPENQMVQHKIQSGNGPLDIHMEQVPKMLRPLVKRWVPDAFVISFKLETDPALLMHKARQALHKYGHTLVIGNILDTRKYTVTFVTESEAEVLTLTEEEKEKNVEIEEPIIEKVIQRHESYIALKKQHH
eukprot:Colp12_sorted_trinity150504_noHs@359